MKLVSEILDNVQIGQDVLVALRENIKKEGMGEVLGWRRDGGGELEEIDEEEEQEQINQQYIKLDKQLIKAEEQEEPEADPMVSFLRKNVLVPLKSMLFYESRSDPGSEK